MLKFYVAKFDPSDDGFTVTFPDVPGAITEGDTFAEAFANAHDALEALLGSLKEDGKPAPVARDTAAVAFEIVDQEAYPVVIICEA
jgi:predicted RNase H-like HicB family nuclease